MYEQETTDVEIVYHTIQVTAAASNAGVFNGVNTQFGWSTHFKTNTGLGTIGGHDNKAPQNTNVLYDGDLVDATIYDQDVIWGIKR